MLKTEELLIAIRDDDDTAFTNLVGSIDEIIAEFGEAQKKTDTLRNRITELTKENSIIKASKGAPEEKISELHKRVRELEEDIANYRENDLVLPLFTPDFNCQSNKLIVIKELKTAIYMNSFLEYLGMSNEVLYNFEKRRILVVVVDDLKDELRNIKYRKHGFRINTEPTDNGIVVTNKTMEELKTFISFDAYDTVIVIDRSMQTTCAVNHPKEDIYYMIDSETDMVDYNVNSKKCIGFFSEEQLVGFTIKPGINILEYTEQRPGLIADCDFVQRILGYED